MAWGGEEEKAQSLMIRLRKDREVSIDLKIVSMEVVHTVNSDRDLKVLTSALAYTDRGECENRSILKCRLHRRIAGLHYRNNDLEEANDHMETALQLAHNLGPDIDTIYTWRLKALMLFEEYKRTKNRRFYKDANVFFTRAMDHARQQPESKRVVTERVKVSKALFHLDMWEEYRQQNKGEDTLEELEFRAQETLDDVDEGYLTDGDKAFFYLYPWKLSTRSTQIEISRS
jgi:tetratricopeptide (TPR) repeat protein